jgi:hypothetical protein
MAIKWKRIADAWQKSGISPKKTDGVKVPIPKEKAREGKKIVNSYS